MLLRAGLLLSARVFLPFRLREHSRLQVNEIVASQAAMSKELDNILEAYFAIEPRLDKSGIEEDRKRTRFVLKPRQGREKNGGGCKKGRWKAFQ